MSFLCEMWITWLRSMRDRHWIWKAFDAVALFVLLLSFAWSAGRGQYTALLTDVRAVALYVVTAAWVSVLALIVWSGRRYARKHERRFHD